MIPYMRMKVPLAGRHSLPPTQPETPAENPPGMTVFEPKEEPQSTPRSEYVRPDIAIPTSPRSVGGTGSSQPPPPEPPFILRILPFIFGFLFLAAVVFLAVRFVPSFFGRNSGPAELVYWGLWEEPQVLETIIADYKRDYPNVTIRYEKQNVKQYYDALANRLSEEGGPDIFRFHNTWVPMLRGFLAPVPSNVYSKEEFVKTFYPVAQKDLLVGEAYIGIPLEIDTLALFVNEEDFQAVGLPPPTTWKEVRDDAYQIRVFDSEKRITKAGLALGTFDNVDAASDTLALMMLQNGVDFKKVDKSTTKDSKSNLGEDVLSYYVGFSQGDNRVWDDTLDPSTLAFAKGKVAMYFGYSWRIFEIKSLNPSLKFKIVPFPRLFDSQPMTFASYWVEGVSKISKHQKEAFAFLKYLSSPEVMQKLYSEQSKLRLFGEPYSRVDLADSLKGNELVYPFVEQAKDATSWYLASNTYDNALDDQMIKYFADAIRAVGTKNVSPKTALETVAKGVNTLSIQYGL